MDHMLAKSRRIVYDVPCKYFSPEKLRNWHVNLPENAATTCIVEFALYRLVNRNRSYTCEGVGGVDTLPSSVHTPRSHRTCTATFIVVVELSGTIYSFQL
jgi:hypothetical protein